MNVAVVGMGVRAGVDTDEPDIEPACKNGQAV